ncbi:MAG TPA: DUF222 domain-containing protein, partial [Aldersonia sp.]
RVLAQIDTRGLAKQLGSKTTGDWFANTGTANPGTAKRMVHTAVGLETLPTVAQALRGGEISAEHAAAIVTAMAAIDRAAPELDETVRAAAIETLLAVAAVHAPYLVAEKGRDLARRFHPRETDVPSEDTTRNYLEISQTRTGRTRIVGDLDALNGDKLRTALSPLCKPAPAADGTPDERTPSERNGDGFATMLDLFLASGAAPTEGGVKPHLVLTAKARDLVACKDETPDPKRFCESAPFRLEWTGAISQELALMLACDCTISKILLDDKEVPLQLGRTQRLVPASLRRALVARDVGCVRCGAPAAWCQGHHLVHWSDGGPTDLDNTALLCGRCHREIHRGYWGLTIGEDGHPWIVPPKWTDKHRKPVPGFFRRTHQEAA